MTFKTDLPQDVIDTIYDTDEMADEATLTPKSTGVEGPTFPCYIGDNVMHGDSQTEDVDEELIEMSTPIANVVGSKERDTITANSIEYEIATAGEVLDSPTTQIAFLQLRRPLNNQTRM